MLSYLNKIIFVCLGFSCLACFGDEVITPYKYLDELPEYSIPANARFALSRAVADDAPEIVYYFSRPEGSTFPIAILCGGSSDLSNIASIIHFHRYFLQECTDLGLAVITLEQWGVDGNKIDKNEWISHYTRSQRLQDKFFEELHECVNHLPKETIRSCEDYWESHQNRLDGVDGPCMVHRDFRPGNMVVYNGKLVGVIDWASARFGFAEQDFCSMEHRSWPKNSEHKQALLAGYSSIRKLPNYNVIMPLLRLGRALAVIGFTVSSGTWDGKDKEIYQYNRKFLDGFFA